jgi:hypothetical protein
MLDPLKGSEWGLPPLTGGDTGMSLDDIWGLDSRDLAGKYPPSVLRLNPRPVGLGLAGRGLGSTDDKVLDRCDAVDAGSDLGVGCGDRTSPASCNAACSSALVGSLIGDLALVASGDEGVDCLPHSAVALLTEANVDFSGDGSSLIEGGSAFADANFSDCVGLGASAVELAVLAGGVGSGREKRDCNGAGEDDDEVGLEGVDWCMADLCGVMSDPDTLFSESNEAGFLGMFGDEVCGDVTDSGRGDFCEISWDPDTLLSTSSELGFLGGSGVDLPNCPDEIRAGLAGVAGLPTMDCLADVFVTDSSSGVPLVLEGTELGRTCSGFTKGTTATSAVTLCGMVFSGSVVACFVAGALRRGPRARPFVMCCNSGAGPVLTS